MKKQTLNEQQLTIIFKEDEDGNMIPYIVASTFTCNLINITKINEAAQQMTVVLNQIKINS